MEPVRRNRILSLMGPAAAEYPAQDFSLPKPMTLMDLIRRAPEMSEYLRDSSFGAGSVGLDISEAGGRPEVQLERTYGLPGGFRLNTRGSAGPETRYIPSLQQAMLSSPEMDLGIPTTARLLYRPSAAGLFKELGNVGGQVDLGEKGGPQLSASGVVSPNSRYRAGLTGTYPISTPPSFPFKNVKLKGEAGMSGSTTGTLPGPSTDSPTGYNFNVNVGGEF